ncbi:hypothetical protein [Brachybacterium sp. NPDC056505]|uniref:hypothetical protein n=1 Tax=Brachybacterium sp. NPDC056505 TaxID=3345843 RepID=UPI00366F6B72
MLTLAAAITPIVGAVLAIAIVATTETHHYLTHRKARPMKNNHTHVTLSRHPELTRDPLGIVTASILVVIALAALIPPVSNGGWWWLLLIVTVPAGVMGATGLAMSIPRRERDVNGNTLER